MSSPQPGGISLRQLLETALAYQQSGKLDEAEALCATVLAALPGQADALHLQAMIHAQTGRPASANNLFQEALAAAPSRADFHANYATSLLEQGRIDEAIARCQHSLGLNPGRSATYHTLGNALLLQNCPEEAAGCFRKAVTINASDPIALNGLGLSLQRLGKNKEAAAGYRQLTGLQPGNASAWHNLGLSLRALGKIAEAGGCFQKALDIAPENAAYAWDLAAVGPHWLMPVTGKRLLLRRYQADDAAFLRACYQDTRFMAQYNHNIMRHHSLDRLSKKLQQMESSHPCQLNSVDWLIIKKDTGQRLGLANLTEIRFSHRRAEFLIGLPNPEDRKTGIGLEASLLVLDYAFNRVGLNKLTAFVYVTNPLAQGNILALGFQQESLLREHFWDKEAGQYYDLYGDGMTLADFRGNYRLARLSKRLLERDITLPPGGPRP